MEHEGHASQAVSSALPNLLTRRHGSGRFRLNFALQGKLASMHTRRALTAVLAAWRMEARCHRRLTALAERLAAAGAQRRMRATFLAWAHLVLAPDAIAARAPDKVSSVWTVSK